MNGGSGYGDGKVTCVSCDAFHSDLRAALGDDHMKGRGEGREDGHELRLAVDMRPGRIIAGNGVLRGANGGVVRDMNC